MRWYAILIAVGFTISVVRADEPAKAQMLTAKEIAEGWICLFDGDSTFGWKIDGEAKVKGGVLVLGGDKATTASTTTEFARFEYAMHYTGKPGVDAPKLHIGKNTNPLNGTADDHGTYNGSLKPKRVSIILETPAQAKVELSLFKLRPMKLESIFNGKDLAGWKQFTEDPKRAKSKFSVTSEGCLSLVDGPGDLQTEKQYDDFILQAECISNGKNLNSGIFFRCIPGQYQNGYEAQIHNGYKNGDRTKPSDYGTGAIYRRTPARKVVSNDLEWFTMTIAAHDNHIATWVNGYQVTDFMDTRPANENPRNGSKTGKGAISIQGHDPTTNLSFRNIRIAELPKK